LRLSSDTLHGKLRAMYREHPIKPAARTIGGITALAKRLGVSRAAVYEWINGRVPAERAVEIERVTNGAVTRQVLRPDIFE